MKTRHVFSVPDIRSAEIAMKVARDCGIADSDISLIARSDIELEAIPCERRVVDGDFYPAAVRGLLGGATTGLLAGVVAVAIPSLGFTLAGAAAMTLGGAALGGWATALAGSAVEDPVRRKFHDEIAQGRILVVLDAPRILLDRVEPSMEDVGAKPLPFDKPTLMT
ncbi:hypothetical protein DVT68_17390 [Dyella solisilvae]|uniref:DUF1269 domain-containing protein n=1 Tax=Dyella solisilvae TaxID=1920168 RepID=A0A370K4D7_9GAMM|nr:hypothetical protein [Dyella solisilvae]RDI97512.1 hypothetical protein DVT68_17390 [Dyella solisilvae]